MSEEPTLGHLRALCVRLARLCGRYRPRRFLRQTPRWARSIADDSGAMRRRSRACRFAPSTRFWKSTWMPLRRSTCCRSSRAYLASHEYTLVENVTNYNKQDNPAWDGTHSERLSFPISSQSNVCDTRTTVDRPRALTHVANQKIAQFRDHLMEYG